MTRKSRREIESAVADMDSDGDGFDLSGGWRFVYRDPQTGRLYDGRGDTPDPIEDLPETVTPVVQRRAVTMMRERAEREGREIIETVDEHSGGEVVSVRCRVAESVDTEAAVQLPDSAATEPLADFTGVDT